MTTSSIVARVAYHAASIPIRSRSEILTTFLEYLESFNRKERFFLVGWALDRPTFRLGEQFRADVKPYLGEIPEDALVFMDYHLDWLHASAFLAGREPDPAGVYDNVHPESIITGNQQDIDLVIAFPTPNAVKLLLLEAKAETGWNNRQLKSKAERLRAIFGERGDRIPGVAPVFALTSPKRSHNIATATWPVWMHTAGVPLWFPLKVPKNRRQVTGWDKAGDRPNKERQWFKLLERADESD